MITPWGANQAKSNLWESQLEKWSNFFNKDVKGKKQLEDNPIH